MSEVVMSLLRRCVGPTQMMVSNIVKIELAYVNTSHPDFIGGSAAVAGLMHKTAKEKEKFSATAAEQSQEPDESAIVETDEDAPEEEEGYEDAVQDKISGGGIMGMLFSKDKNLTTRKKKDRKSIEPPSIGK